MDKVIYEEFKKYKKERRDLLIIKQNGYYYTYDNDKKIIENKVKI